MVVAGASTLAYAANGRSSQIFGRSVHKGPGKRKSVALTFDDGPSESSLRLLDYLSKQGVQATFFQCGINILRHPEIARRVSLEGHEVANHSFSHARLCPRLGWKTQLISPNDIYVELASAQEVIVEEVGVCPTLFRPPYGLRWFGVGAAQQRLNLLGVQWTVIGRDWELPSDQIAKLVLGKSAPGGIICLHDGRDIQPNPDTSDMLTAVKSIIPRLKDEGYNFETVSMLLRSDERFSENSSIP
jgi:peptidoglycan-N-acetylglucosamine deacetylase